MCLGWMAMARPSTKMLRTTLSAAYQKWSLSVALDHAARLVLAGIFVWFWWHWRGAQTRMDTDLARLGALAPVQLNDYLAVSLMRHAWMLIPLLYVGTRFTWKQILVIAVWVAVGCIFVFDQYAASANFNRAVQQQIIASPDGGSQQNL
jgi:hypothetical protein